MNVLSVLLPIKHNMEKILLLFSIITLFASLSKAQTSFDFEPGQCMLLTGKGPGQDGSINPFYGQECIAVVENIGECLFYITNYRLLILRCQFQAERVISSKSYCASQSKTSLARVVSAKIAGTSPFRLAVTS